MEAPPGWLLDGGSGKILARTQASNAWEHPLNHVHAMVCSRSQEEEDPFQGPTGKTARPPALTPHCSPISFCHLSPGLSCLVNQECYLPFQDGFLLCPRTEVVQCAAPADLHVLSRVLEAHSHNVPHVTARAHMASASNNFYMGPLPLPFPCPPARGSHHHILPAPSRLLGHSGARSRLEGSSSSQ